MLTACFRRVLLSFSFTVFICSCSSYERLLELSPVPKPSVYADPTLRDRLITESPLPAAPVLYVTDRKPASAGDIEDYYRNERGSVLRVGRGNAATCSELDKKSCKTTISSVEEVGVLSSIPPFGELTTLGTDFSTLTPADQWFQNSISERLKRSRQKDVFIYVHGYKVVFENPILIASELWRFFGYEGVFLAYAWPSTPKRFAYFKDIETAQLSGQNLRMVLEQLAKNKDVGNIHILGYSAGTRVVVTALHQLALKYNHLSVESLSDQLKIGNVILTASDYDMQVFASYIGNNLAEVSKRLTIYMSGSDDALSISSFVFSERRLGQFVLEDKQDLPAPIRNYFTDNPSLNFINATNAAKSSSGNGHGYFLRSPWVSSDILLLLKHDLPPSSRGLVREEGSIHWDFSDDYLERLKSVKHGLN